MKTTIFTPTLNEADAMLLAGRDLEASAQSWEAAEVLVSQRLHRDALGRAASSLFHAVRAVLLRAGYNVRSSGEVLDVLSLRFAGAGELPPEIAAVLARAQRYQELCDFGVGWVVTPERVVAELEVYEEHRSGLLSVLASRGVKSSA
ncbi:MAG: HEPN domain-containing protein [Deltaproteobacteria bacterium]|nr:HEPN domain-containing protein [Deltaproteobacteria bacterium]